MRTSTWSTIIMALLPVSSYAVDRPVDLMVSCRGSDTGSRTFGVIDDHKIASRPRNMNRLDEFFDVTYPILEDFTGNKDKATVRFQSHPGNMAGGVFGCRMVKREATPAAAAALLETLDPFYKQHLVADGLLIVSSEKVSEYALCEAAHLVRKMLANRPDVLERLVEKKMYVCVMAYNEMQTDLPECRKLSPWYDKRARGLGGTPVSCGEENLLGFNGDPYRGENIFIHEFAHGIHGAIAGLDERFEMQLRTLHKKAKETGRFRGYGMGTFGEFWAEGVQSWFNCNRDGGLEAFGPEGERLCQVNTRRQLKEHMPELAELIDETFRRNRWVYRPVLGRLNQPHLRGYDPAQAPTFRWPPEVIETYNRIEAEKAKKRKTREEQATST